MEIWGMGGSCFAVDFFGGLTGGGRENFGKEPRLAEGTGQPTLDGLPRVSKELTTYPRHY